MSGKKWREKQPNVLFTDEEFQRLLTVETTINKQNTNLNAQLKEAQETIKKLHKQNIKILKNEIMLDDACEKYLSINSVTMDENDEPEKVANALRMIRYHMYPREEEEIEKIVKYEAIIKEQEEIIAKQRQSIEELTEQVKRKPLPSVRTKIIPTKSLLHELKVEEVEAILASLKGEEIPIIEETIHETFNESMDEMPSMEMELDENLPEPIVDESVRVEVKQYLDERLAQYKKSENPAFDAVIDSEDQGEITLKYIDFPLREEKDYTPVMKQSQQVLFLFPTKKLQKEAKDKFAMWLCLHAEKKQTYRYYFANTEEPTPGKKLPALEKYVDK